METLNKPHKKTLSRKDFDKFFLDYHMGQQYHNQRFGQAFVNKYLLHDKELFYEKDDNKSNKMILEKYVGQ